MYPACLNYGWHCFAKEKCHIKTTYLAAMN